MKEKKFRNKIKGMKDKVMFTIKKNGTKIGIVLIACGTGFLAFKVGCGYTEAAIALGLDKIFRDGTLAFMNPETGEQISMDTAYELLKAKYDI